MSGSIQGSEQHTEGERTMQTIEVRVLFGGELSAVDQPGFYLQLRELIEGFGGSTSSLVSISQADQQHRWSRCDGCGSEVEFQAWATEDGSLVSFQDGAENWCPGCEEHDVGYTVMNGYPVVGDGASS